MQGAVQKLHQKKNQERGKYEDHLKEIASLEQAEMAQIEEAIIRERKQGLKDIENELEDKKKNKLAGMEKKLEKAKKEDNIDFAVLLADYDQQVKQVNEQQENER